MVEPPSDRGSDVEEDNMQVPLEMPPSEDVSTQIPLGSRTDVDTPQD